MKTSGYLLAFVLFFASCTEKKYGAFTVSGKIENAAGKKILLQELPYGGEQPVVLDSVSLAANGSYELNGIGIEEGLYRLVVENGPDVLLINDAKNIVLNFDVNNYRAYQVSGSPASESLHILFEEYKRRDSALYTTFQLLDTLQKQKDTDSLVIVTRMRRDLQVKDLNKMITDFLGKSNSPAAHYYALGIAARTLKPDQMRALTNVSADKFKEHSGLAKIKSLLAVQEQATPAGYALLNQTAPEINLLDVNGKPFTLSSLRGKYVLVDFWASWCGPCRRENPNVVKAYHTFKDKNFTILGVSLDADKADWIQAIKDDGLSWMHVSDLKQWESSMVPLYQFNAIPFNVLIDPQGKIIANDLRGAALESKLAELIR